MATDLLYAAIDLHSDTSYLTIIDEQDRRVFDRRLKNVLAEILLALAIFRQRIVAIAVESTFNWYWLVDGLMAHGYEVKLVNTSAVRQYEGLKHTDDRHDAFWLAHLMRLGILPTGYIHPPEHRAVRDLLRKRMCLVQQRTACILSIQNLQRNEGVRMSVGEIKHETIDTIAQSVKDSNRAMALRTTQAVIMTLTEQIDKIERSTASAPAATGVEAAGQCLGNRPILTMTIMLEAGNMSRFASVGDFVSYCRCVKADRWSNGKKKGENNEKNGNQYLA
jgi:transposase